MTKDSFSLGAGVYRTIREGILSGKYQPDEELREKSIGQELGVSRTPVREALRQLELEGLVRIIPNKGAYVEGVTYKDIHDIYEIRALLEGLCASWAAKNISDDLLNELEENICLAGFHEEKGDYEKLVALDSRFHEIIYEACNSKELKKVLKVYHEYVRRARATALIQPQRAKNSTYEHRLIAEAIKNHDEKMAEEYARNHIKSTMGNMDKLGWENLIK